MAALVKPLSSRRRLYVVKHKAWAAREWSTELWKDELTACESSLWALHASQGCLKFWCNQNILQILKQNRLIANDEASLFASVATALQESNLNVGPHAAAQTQCWVQWELK